MAAPGAYGWPGMEHICCFCYFLCGFKPIFRSPMYVMDQNDSLRFLPCASIVFDSNEIYMGSVGAL